MAGWPALAGSVTSHTPNESLAMGVASRFHPSGDERQPRRSRPRPERGRTEVTDQEGLGGVGSPFPVDNVPIVSHVEPEFLAALDEHRLSMGPPSALRAATDPAEPVQASLGLVDRLDPALGVTVSFTQRLLEGREPGIQLHHAWSTCTVVSSSTQLRPSSH